MDTKRGQAMMELALGMFAMALAVSALCWFAIYTVKSLKIQNSLRTKAHSGSTSITVDDFAKEYLFGSGTVRISEKAEIPERTILE